jgi:tetratricopeptide (TPR) repeat protein
LFAIHPVTVASVAWPSQIKNTLSLVPFMAAAWCYLHFDTLNQRRWYFGSLVLFTLALLSKSSTVVLPALLAAVILWRHGRITWRHGLTLAPLLLLAIGAAGVTVIFQTQQAISGGNPRPEGLLSRVAATGWVLWFYLRNSLAPTDLMMVYPRWQLDERRALAWLPLAAWLVMLALLAWRGWRGRLTGKARPSPAAAVFFSMSCFTLALGPVLGVMTMYYARYSLVSDHLQYLALPAITGLIAAALGWRAGVRARRAARTLAAVLMLTWCVMTFTHARDFCDEASMWQANLDRDPQSWLAAHGVARHLAQQGRVTEAAALFEQSLRGNPNYERAHVNLGLIRAREGRMNDAIAHFARAAEIQPRYAQAQRYLGRALADQGQLAPAADRLRAAVLLRPAEPDLRLEWALVLLRGQRYDEAIEQLQQALALDSELDAARFNLAQALLQRGRSAEAMPHLQRLAQKHPGDAAVQAMIEQANQPRP